MNTTQIIMEISSSCRALWRQPKATFIAVACMGLGMSTSIAVFTLVRSELLRPLPYQRPEQLLAITAVSARQPNGIVLTPEFAAWRDESHSLAQLGAWNDAAFNLTGAGEPERLNGAEVDVKFLDLLGVVPAIGRPFQISDERDREHVVLITHQLWSTRFGADPKWIGRTVRLNDQPYAVIGVLPVDFRFPGPFQPELLVLGGYSGPSNWSVQNMAQLNVVGRLADGATPESVAAELTGLQMRHEQERPQGLARLLQGRTIRTLPLAVDLSRNFRTPLLILMGAVALVVIIVCINVASVQLSRTLRRYGEFSARAALGASKASLARLVLTESILISIMGTTAGAFGAVALIRVLPKIGAQLVGSGTPVRMDATVIAFSFSLALISGLICTTVNAVAIYRFEMKTVADRGGRSVVSGPSRALWYGLIAGQVAIAFVLLFGLSILLRSFINVLRTDTGLRAERVLSFTLRLPGSRYKGPPSLAFADDLLRRLGSLPGVESAAIATSPPFSPYSRGEAVRTTPEVRTDTRQTVPVIAVSRNYFKTLGIPLAAGEELRETDVAGQKTAVVNLAFARRFFPNEDPVGRPIYFGSDEMLTVLGVVGDVRHIRPEEPPQPEIFVPLNQNPPLVLGALVRTFREPTSLLSAIRREVGALDSDIPLFRVSTLEQRLSELRSLRRFQMWLLSWFAVFSVALAGVGLYGSMLYTVNQSRREIGLRMALGAQVSQVRNYYLKRGVWVCIWGLTAGLIVSLTLSHYLKSVVFDVSPTDPAGGAAAALLLLATGVLASYLPARSASRTDPSSMLRHD